MNFKAWLMPKARDFCHLFGYDLRSVQAKQAPTVEDVQAPEEAPTLHNASRRLKQHDIPFDYFLDAGASDGAQSRALAEPFPGKRHLLLEANKIHLPALAKVCQEHQNWSFRFAAQEAKAALFTSMIPTRLEAISPKRH